ncbi:MurR/RpiR family transcriptional regulator [Kocuria coralli]|uniref:MurR/RpiR family transcriptional regulator n=1 Tax=Kocuria coralli TaxID=1461025 RepID=A0A5J5L0Z5_9MICC|nr:MurR/RpiR family transcriptional regulator [Kocuria coralli]KAA9394736.1 MurR/RpiR family transcriptional regulator [Kocuria coralli]
MKQQIADRITAGYARLTPQEQRAADVVLAHLDDLAVYSSAELAEVAGVSRATFSRLYRHLGFESSSEVKELARMRRYQGVPVPAAVAAGTEAGATEHVADERRNLEAVFTPERTDRLEEAAQAILRARQILVIGWRNSYPVALHLRTQLQQARPGVRMAPAPGQTLSEELMDVGPEDLVVAVGFRRRPRVFEAALHGCGLAGVPVLLIADGTARALAGSVRYWLECPVDRAGAFDSYATAFSLVAWLADAVLRDGGEPAAERVDRATELFEALQELELR